MTIFRSQSSEVRIQLVLFSVLCFLSSVFCGCQKEQLYKDSRIMMGTFVEVISPDKRGAAIAFAEMKRIDNLLSKYNPESEISRLNKLGELKVSAETLYILRRAKEFWLLSDGAFDVSVGPLADLWGFTDKQYRSPDTEEIKKTLVRVGMDKIVFNDKDSVVKFSVQGMRIDLGAIAKGYAVDCAVKKLKAAGIRSCLINAGGQIYALGDRFGRGWKIAIRNPRSQGFTDYLTLKDKAVATSGDYEQYFFHRHKRYAHIFNPKTGYPADSGLVSVTVIAPDGLTSDALATSIFVLGKDKGEKLAKKFSGTKVKIIEEKSSGY